MSLTFDTYVANNGRSDAGLEMSWVYNIYGIVKNNNTINATQS